MGALLAQLVTIFQLMIVVRIILTWVQVSPFNPFVRFLSQVCDPLLDATRNAFPFLAQGGIDFSPIVVLFLLDFTKRMLFGLGF